MSHEGPHGGNQPEQFRSPKQEAEAQFQGLKLDRIQEAFFHRLTDEGNDFVDFVSAENEEKKEKVLTHFTANVFAKFNAYIRMCGSDTKPLAREVEKTNELLSKLQAIDGDPAAEMRNVLIEARELLEKRIAAIGAGQAAAENNETSEATPGTEGEVQTEAKAEGEPAPTAEPETGTQEEKPSTDTESQPEPTENPESQKPPETLKVEGLNFPEAEYPLFYHRGLDLLDLALNGDSEKDKEDGANDLHVNIYEDFEAFIDELHTVEEVEEKTADYEKYLTALTPFEHNIEAAFKLLTKTVKLLKDKKEDFIKKGREKESLEDEELFLSEGKNLLTEWLNIESIDQSKDLSRREDGKILKALEKSLKEKLKELKSSPTTAADLKTMSEKTEDIITDLKDIEAAISLKPFIDVIASYGEDLYTIYDSAEKKEILAQKLELIKGIKIFEDATGKNVMIQWFEAGVKSSERKSISSTVLLNIDTYTAGNDSREEKVNHLTKAKDALVEIEQTGLGISVLNIINHLEEKIRPIAEEIRTENEDKETAEKMAKSKERIIALDAEVAVIQRDIAEYMDTFKTDPLGIPLDELNARLKALKQKYFDEAESLPEQERENYKDAVDDSFEQFREDFKELRKRKKEAEKSREGGKATFEEVKKFYLEIIGASALVLTRQKSETYLERTKNALNTEIRIAYKTNDIEIISSLEKKLEDLMEKMHIEYGFEQDNFGEDNENTKGNQEIKFLLESTHFLFIEKLTDIKKKIEKLEKAAKGKKPKESEPTPPPSPDTNPPPTPDTPPVPPTPEADPLLEIMEGTLDSIPDNIKNDKEFDKWIKQVAVEAKRKGRQEDVRRTQEEWHKLYTEQIKERMQRLTEILSDKDIAKEVFGVLDDETDDGKKAKKNFALKKKIQQIEWLLIEDTHGTYARMVDSILEKHENSKKSAEEIENLEKEKEHLQKLLSNQVSGKVPAKEVFKMIYSTGAEIAMVDEFSDFLGDMAENYTYYIDPSKEKDPAAMQDMYRRYENLRKDEKAPYHKGKLGKIRRLWERVKDIAAEAPTYEDTEVFRKNIEKLRELKLVETEGVSKNTAEANMEAFKQIFQKVGRHVRNGMPIEDAIDTEVQSDEEREKYKEIFKEYIENRSKHKTLQNKARGMNAQTVLNDRQEDIDKVKNSRATLHKDIASEIAGDAQQKDDFYKEVEQAFSIETLKSISKSLEGTGSQNAEVLKSAREKLAMINPTQLDLEGTVEQKKLIIKLAQAEVRYAAKNPIGLPDGALSRITTLLDAHPDEFSVENKKALIKETYNLLVAKASQIPEALPKAQMNALIQRFFEEARRLNVDLTQRT